MSLGQTKAPVGRNTHVILYGIKKYQIAVMCSNISLPN